MKIRIKGNSIRLRLTKTDVKNLREHGIVKEETIFNSSVKFTYELLKTTEYSEFHSKFENGTITVLIPEKETKVLTETEEITVKSVQNNSENDGLFILVEKDLQCLDASTEDQSDMYENPNSSC